MPPPQTEPNVDHRLLTVPSPSTPTWQDCPREWASSGLTSALRRRGPSRNWTAPSLTVRLNPSRSSSPTTPPTTTRRCPHWLPTYPPSPGATGGPSTTPRADSATFRYPRLPGLFCLRTDQRERKKKRELPHPPKKKKKVSYVALKKITEKEMREKKN